MNVMVEISAGELIDKITILEIKTDQISDPSRLVHIRQELEHLSAVRNRQIPPSDGLRQLTAELRQVNRELWQVEDELRDCERRKDFGPDFIRLARSVYLRNDRRAAVKRAISELTGSRLVEEKSYAEYKAA